LYYIICHSDETEKIAKSFGFGVPVRVSDTSEYFESQVFDYLLTNQHEWSSKRFVGILNYKFFTVVSKTQFNAIIYHNSFDVISFLNFEHQRMVGELVFEVPFWESVSMLTGSSGYMAIYKMLTAAGYTDEQITNPLIKGFYRNWWVSKPLWMKRYIDFFQTCKCLVNSNKSLRRYLDQVAYYSPEGSLDKDRLQQIFQSDHYHQTPFVFERLPSFFFHINQANMSRQCIISNFSIVETFV
jgi:hypothetical protein